MTYEALSYRVRRRRPVRVRRRVRLAVGAAGPAGRAVAVAPGQTGLLAAGRGPWRAGAALPLVDYQVDGHLALQAGDVTVAEVIAEFVNLKWKEMIDICCALNVQKILGND